MNTIVEPRSIEDTKVLEPESKTAYSKAEPELRFEGFTNEWPEKKLGSVLTIGSGKDYKHLDNGDIPVFGTGGYMLSVNDYLYDGASVCIGRKGTIDKPRLLRGKFWTVDTLFYTHSYKKSIPEFIFGLFQNINWKKYNEASGVPSLSKSTIEKIKVGIPNVEEQQKIADFLSSVDKKIEQLTEKHRLLNEYKKGVMQQIFTQQIRFKDNQGNDYPEWEEKRLGDFLIFAKNGLSSNQVSETTDYPVTRIETISAGKINLNKVGYILPDKDISDSKLESGDILFSNINSVAHIGKVAFVGENITLYHGMNLLCLRPDKNVVLPMFLFMLLTRKEIKQYFERICNQAVNQASINQTDLKKTPLALPCIEEQQKIANFLTEIDQKIDQAWSTLEQTKAFKKGLLQKMFV